MSAFHPKQTLASVHSCARRASERGPFFVSQSNIVAVGLLPQRDLERLGPTFERAWPIDEAPCFSDLLRAIDEADREIRRVSDPSADSSSVEI